MTYNEHTIKKKNGKIRKIVAPDKELKNYQRKELDDVLTPKFKMMANSFKIYDCFHGFVPRRNSVTAAAQHIGYEATIMFDFADFFDTITFDHIQRAGYTLNAEQKEHLLHKEGYCAQGFPSSPMLANIALIPFVVDMKNWLSIHTDNDFAITLYADDIQISINNTDPSYWREIRDTLYRKAEEHFLTINPSKTRIRFAKYGHRRILGVNVTSDSVLPTRKTNRKVRAVAHQVSTDNTKANVLGGLRVWQMCHYPKGIDFTL